MATEQIQTNQIAGFTGSGARMETKFITTSGGASASTPLSTSAFSFVVGPVLIEITSGSNDSVTVYATMWANMRSFSGTKTADVTDRIARGVAGSGHCRCLVDRGTSGTVLTLSHVDQGSDFNADGTSVATTAPKNWPNPGRIRITAWEDTQA